MLESLVRYVNSYAYVYVGLHGKSFLQAASETFTLLHLKGYDLIVNDSLSGTVLTTGSVLAGIVTAIAGGYWSILYTADTWTWGFWCFVVGYLSCSMMLVVVKSATITMFVCLAEDPAMLQNTRPALFRKFKSAADTYYLEAQQRAAGDGNQAERDEAAATAAMV
jgi:hypothetical protein